MRTAILMLFLIVPAAAQDRILLGPTFSYGWGNTALGPTARIELSRLRWEADADITLSPVASHVAIGAGASYAASAEGDLYATHTLGAFAKLADSSYRAATLSKSQLNAAGGLAIRATLFGNPTKYSIGYLREVDDRVEHGVEPNRTQGAMFRYETDFGCARHTCIVFAQEITAGRSLNQGNPTCDGTLPGPMSCPRTATFSGGIMTTVFFSLGGGSASKR